MGMMRPFRNFSVYASPCLECGEEIENAVLPIPLRCVGCEGQEKTTA